MLLILPKGDLGALTARIERRFAITMATHWSEMRGGIYLRWPRTRLSLLARLRLRYRPEAPPFNALLVFWNCEAEDPEPFVEGYSPDCWLVDLTGDADGEAARWFIANEAAVTVSR
jgi:hypothetical protein